MKKKILRWTLGLLALPLLLGLGWTALNHFDAPPQPWPERLQLPGNTVAEADNLLLQLDKAPSMKGRIVSVNDCKADDCLPMWRERLPQFAALRDANPGFIEACVRLSAVGDLRIEDPLPARLRPDSPLPAYSPLSRCHQDLLARALAASEAGDAAQALRWLQQADRVDRALLAGGRMLIAQMIGVSLGGRKLEVISGVAQAHPALRQDLAPLAALDAGALLAKQREWVIVEANFMRGANDGLRPGQPCFREAEPGWAQRLLCRLHQGVAQPEYTEQLMRDRWLHVLDTLDAAQDLPSALPAARAHVSGQAQTSPWQRIRHTVPHILDDVARPAWAGYLERSADLQLAAEATRLWLQGSAPADASPALRERLRVDAQGWQLTPFHEQSRGRLPAALAEAELMPPEILDFLARYAAAYTRLDGDAVAALCTLPLTISQGGRLTCWTEAESVRDNMRQLCAIYAEARLARAEPELLDWQALGAHDGFARVRWCLWRKDGGLIQQFMTGYQLLRQGDDWRVAHVVAFDENLDAMRHASQD